MAVHPARVVTVARPGLGYALTAPYDAPNPVYEAVEAMFRRLGLDSGRAGTPEWNPLGDVISPGDRVVISGAAFLQPGAAVVEEKVPEGGAG